MTTKGESEKPDDAKRDELLRRLLKTPPTPHKPPAVSKNTKERDSRRPAKSKGS